MNQPPVYETGDRVHVTTTKTSGTGYIGYRAGTTPGTYNVQLDDTRHVEATPAQMRLIQKGTVR